MKITLTLMGCVQSDDIRCSRSAPVVAKLHSNRMSFDRHSCRMAPTVQRKRSNPDSAVEGLMAVLDQEAGQRQTVRLLALAERVLR